MTCGGIGDKQDPVSSRLSVLSSVLANLPAAPRGFQVAARVIGLEAMLAIQPSGFPVIQRRNETLFSGCVQAVIASELVQQFPGLRVTG
jgi:hypothetical protein